MEAAGGHNWDEYQDGLGSSECQLQVLTSMVSMPSWKKVTCVHVQLKKKNKYTLMDILYTLLVL